MQTRRQTHRNDQLAAQRRELPRVPIDKDYRFDTDEGSRTLRELFGGRSQLLVYHFMFGPTMRRHDEYDDANAAASKPEPQVTGPAAHDHPDHPIGAGRQPPSANHRPAHIGGSVSVLPSLTSHSV